MSTLRDAVVVVCVVLGCVTGVWAQDYTFTVTDVPVTTGQAGRTINLVGIATDGVMAGNDNTPQGYGSRISPTLDVTRVTCPPERFTRDPSASTAGPEVVTMNNALTVVGNDEGTLGSLPALYGFVQSMDGLCDFFLVPGSFGTLFTALDDSGSVAGEYWNDPAVEVGLLRFHAFIKTGDALTLFTTGVSNDVVWITGVNDAGDVIGYAYRDMQPDNSYTYQAFYYSAGAFTWLDGPAGEDVWPIALNNAGQVTAVLHPQGVIGGPGWLYDNVTQTWTQLPFPSPQTTSFFPRALNDQGTVVGVYTEFFADPPPFGHSTTHQVQAVPPAPPDPIVGDPLDPDDPPWHGRRHHRHGRQHMEHWRHDGEAHTGWWHPVLDDDGTVCMTDGKRIIGRRHR